jgi:thioredoxin-like negative regulator of GroEL
MPTRLEKIQAMLQDDPTDSFLRYSLAMEYASHGQDDNALVAFTSLTKDKKPHVAAFFQAAQLLLGICLHDFKHGEKDPQTRQQRRIGEFLFVPHLPPADIPHPIR